MPTDYTQEVQEAMDEEYNRGKPESERRPAKRPRPHKFPERLEDAGIRQSENVEDRRKEPPLSEEEEEFLFDKVESERVIPRYKYGPPRQKVPEYPMEKADTSKPVPRSVSNPLMDEEHTVENPEIDYGRWETLVRRAANEPRPKNRLPKVAKKGKR